MSRIFARVWALHVTKRGKTTNQSVHAAACSCFLSCGPTLTAGDEDTQANVDYAATTATGLAHDLAAAE